MFMVPPEKSVKNAQAAQQTYGNGISGCAVSNLFFLETNSLHNFLPMKVCSNALNRLWSKILSWGINKV